MPHCVVLRVAFARALREGVNRHGARVLVPDSTLQGVRVLPSAHHLMGLADVKAHQPLVEACQHDHNLKDRVARHVGDGDAPLRNGALAGAEQPAQLAVGHEVVQAVAMGAGNQPHAPRLARASGLDLCRARDLIHNHHVWSVVLAGQSQGQVPAMLSTLLPPYLDALEHDIELVGRRLDHHSPSKADRLVGDNAIPRNLIAGVDDDHILLLLH